MSITTYDLTDVIAPYLDRHLVLPLLEHLQKSKLYDEKQILDAKLDLLMHTNLVDFAKEIARDAAERSTTGTSADKERYERALKELSEKRPHVIATFNRLNKQDAAPLLRVLDDQDKLDQLRAAKNFTMAYLEQHEGVTVESLENLYKLAKHLFDCGTYTKAAEYLYHYRQLSTHPDRLFSALWGKFAAEILNPKHNWNAALEDMKRLKDTIDQRSFSSQVIQLQQRTWLIHWALFVFFNHPDGKTELIDMFFQENSITAQRYLNAVQTTCPHILRYITTAVIVNKKRRNVLKELVRVIQQEAHSYRDPVTELIECLYVNFDFEVAQLKLRECDRVLSNDFFLVSCRDEFIENARLFIFETYCRIHQVIDLSMLAEKLNMDVVAAEKWIVNMIRNARLDAKIDSARNRVVMGAWYPSVYQQVIEKTKGLAFRTYMLANTIDAVVTANAPAQSVVEKS